MNSQPRPYQKLPGRSHGSGGRSQLWLGDDHLLEVHSIIFAERYLRYPLADIRAITVEPSRTAAIWSALCGGGIALALLAIGGLWWGTTQVSERELVPVLWVFAGMFGCGALFLLFLLIVNLWRGPSCRCTIQTSAGMRPLTTPTRRATARRVLERLEPVIEAAQKRGQP